MQGKYLAIRDAVLHRARLLVRQRNVWLTLCPHVLGWRKEEPYVVAYAATGTRRWLCLPLAEINYVRATDGHWLPETGSPPTAEMQLDFVTAASTSSEALPLRETDPTPVP